MAFDYILPKEKIAQRPCRERGTSRMLVSRRLGPALEPEDSAIVSLPDYLDPGDVLVLNDSRVLPCRFFAEKPDSGAEVEILLVREESREERVWVALARPMKRLRPGTQLRLSERLRAEVLGRAGAEEEYIRLRLDTGESEPIISLIEKEGTMPIPGYIRGGHGDESDRSQYQTVFSGEPGSIAAPTAGLHFTSSLLAQLERKEIRVCRLTLHVGVASFAPVKDLAEHRMPAEWYRIPLETALAVERAKAAGRRVCAVGTTSTRSLESAALSGALGRSEDLQATELFITPGFSFRVVDCLLTNFHQPGTTHLFLVSAFCGEERARKLYEHALNSGYRFLSYGDCMLLL